MSSLSDVLTTIQNGVIALNNLSKQVTGSLRAIQTSIAATVTSFKTRTGAVVPVQGDYPTNLIPGTTTNDSATAGNIGELLTAGPTVQALGTGVSIDVTSVVLTAGDWELSGFIQFSGVGATTTTDVKASLSIVSATLNLTVGRYAAWRGTTLDLFFPVPVGPLRVSIAGNTTYYLVAQAAFGGGTFSSEGILHARRAR